MPHVSEAMQGVFLAQDGVEPDFDSLNTADLMAFDVESSGLHPATHDFIGVSFAVNTSSGYYFQCGDERFPWQQLENPNVLKVAHNAAFDRLMLKKQGILANNFADTLIAAHMLWDEHLSLKHLSLQHLGIVIPTFSEIGGLSATLQQMGTMSAKHSLATLQLWQHYEPLLQKWGMSHLFWDIQMPLVPVISDMELEGIAVDEAELDILGVEFLQKADAIARAIESLTGISNVNYNSADQVAWLLFEKLGLKPGHLTKGGKRPSTDATELEKLKSDHPAVNLILVYKQYRKLVSQYVVGMKKELVNRRIHTSFNQAGTSTGRLSSSGPNLQNIPKRRPDGRRIRRAFVASPGCVLIVPDFDQLELKDLAIHSKDPYLLDAFRSERDIHTETALRAFGSASKRAEGKTLNYRVTYGGGQKKDRQKFFEAYPVAAEWIQRKSLEASENGYAKTRHGRIRLLPEAQSSNPRKAAHGQREAISTIVQGSSAEEVFRGMIKVWAESHDTEVKMLLQVHDEIILEVPEGMVDDVVPMLKQELTCDDYDIPLTVSIKVGKNWKDLHEYQRESTTASGETR